MIEQLKQLLEDMRRELVELRDGSVKSTNEWTADLKAADVLEIYVHRLEVLTGE